MKPRLAYLLALALLRFDRHRRQRRDARTGRLLREGTLQRRRDKAGGRQHQGRRNLQSINPSRHPSSPSGASVLERNDDAGETVARSMGKRRKKREDAGSCRKQKER